MTWNPVRTRIDVRRYPKQAPWRIRHVIQGDCPKCTYGRVAYLENKEAYPDMRLVCIGHSLLHSPPCSWTADLPRGWSRHIIERGRL